MYRPERRPAFCYRLSLQVARACLHEIPGLGNLSGTPTGRVIPKLSSLGDIQIPSARPTPVAHTFTPNLDYLTNQSGSRLAARLYNRTGGPAKEVTAPTKDDAKRVPSRGKEGPKWGLNVPRLSGGFRRDAERSTRDSRMQRGELGQEFSRKNSYDAYRARQSRTDGQHQPFARQSKELRSPNFTVNRDRSEKPRQGPNNQRPFSRQRPVEIFSDFQATKPRRSTNPKLKVSVANAEAESLPNLPTLVSLPQTDLSALFGPTQPTRAISSPTPSGSIQDLRSQWVLEQAGGDYSRYVPDGIEDHGIVNYAHLALSRNRDIGLGQRRGALEVIKISQAR